MWTSNIKTWMCSMQLGFCNFQFPRWTKRVTNQSRLPAESFYKTPQEGVTTLAKAQMFNILIFYLETLFKFTCTFPKQNKMTKLILNELTASLLTLDHKIKIFLSDGWSYHAASLHNRRQRSYWQAPAWHLHTSAVTGHVSQIVGYSHDWHRYEHCPIKTVQFQQQKSCQPIALVLTIHFPKHTSF